MIWVGEGVGVGVMVGVGVTDGFWVAVGVGVGVGSGILMSRFTSGYGGASGAVSCPLWAEYSWNDAVMHPLVAGSGSSL